MLIDKNNMPKDIASIKKLALQLNKKLISANTSITKLREEKNKLNQKLISAETRILRQGERIRLLSEELFGQSTEKRKKQKHGECHEQDPLFNEEKPEESCDSDEQAVEKRKEAPVGWKSSKSKPKRKPIPANIPREPKKIALSEKERVCSDCRVIMKENGDKVSEYMDALPQIIKAIKIIRKQYKCKKCGKSKIASNPMPIPKSIAGPGLLAQIIVNKYCNHIPLYRMEGMFVNAGVDISRGMMSDWMIKSADLMMPLFNLLQDELLSSKYVQMDETPLQVLSEPGKKAESKSYMWVRGRDGVKPIILYEYDPTRSGDVPKKLLPGFKGYLQTDAYRGYNALCRENPEIIRLGCWDHARRKFFEAHKITKKQGKTGKALSYIEKLYKLEKYMRESKLGAEEKYKIRQEKSKMILDSFHEWLEKTRITVAPESPLGKAISYALNEWKYLKVYIRDGNLNISNQFVENKIRPFAIGRKNWLFSQSVKGANASAIIYSIMATATANGHEPFAYFRYILQEIPKGNTVEDFEKLLPTRISPADYAAANVDC